MRVRDPTSDETPGLVVPTERGRQANRQGHFEHNVVHDGCAVVPDDHGVE
jgi:hypothetical protein